MKKIIIAILIILCTASYVEAQYKYRTSGTGTITASDCSTYTAIGQLCQDTDDGKLYKGTGSAVEEIGSGSGVSSYTDVTTLWGSGSCSGLLNSDGTCKAIGTDVQAYDANTIKKAAAALTTGQYVVPDAEGNLISAGAPVTGFSSMTTDTVVVKTGSSTIASLSSENVETSGYLSGRMRAVVVLVPSGVHDGDNDAAIMTDGGIDIGASALVGMTVYNITDGSSCTITANTATTITCTLAGGTGNDWDTNDVWQVGPGPAQSGSVFYVGSAGTIRHPATVGYLAGYYTTAAAAVIINPASDTMVIANATASAIDAGDAIDSPATAGSYIFLHNASATLAYTLGKNGTYTDGGAD